MEDQITVSSGRKCCELYSYSSHGGSSLRMFVESLVSRTAWYSSRCVLIWKTQATTSKRLLFLLLPSMRTTEETESGLWPTPRAGTPGSRPNGKGGKILAEEAKKSVKMWPTPNGDDANQGEAVRRSGAFRSLTADVKESRGENPIPGSLNPAWVAWLMNFPLDWLDLDGYQNPELEGLPPEYLTESTNSRPSETP